MGNKIKRFRVVYNLLLHGNFILTSVVEYFKKEKQAKDYLAYLKMIPKDEKNERIFKGSAKVEELCLKDICTLNNTKTWKWYPVK